MKWVGRVLGDHRVLCYNNHKVYTCPEAASKDLNLTETDIAAVCNRYLRFAGENFKFDWYAQYVSEQNELGRKILYYPHPPRIVKKKRKLTHREILRKRNLSLKKYRGMIPPVLRLTHAIFRKTGAQRFNMFVKDWLALLEKEANSQGWSLGTSPSAFTRHLKTHAKVYDKIMGMELGMKYCGQARKRITTIRLKFIPEASEKDIYVYDDLESYEMVSRKNGIPVIHIEDNRIFGGISTAARITGIPRRYIVWCCNGDLDSISFKGTTMTFAYVEWED